MPGWRGRLCTHLQEEQRHVGELRRRAHGKRGQRCGCHDGAAPAAAQRQQQQGKQAPQERQQGATKRHAWCQCEKACSMARVNCSSLATRDSWLAGAININKRREWRHAPGVKVVGLSSTLLPGGPRLDLGGALCSTRLPLEPHLGSGWAGVAGCAGGYNSGRALAQLAGWMPEGGCF